MQTPPAFAVECGRMQHQTMKAYTSKSFEDIVAMRLLSVGQAERTYHSDRQESSEVWISQIGKCMQQNQPSQVTPSLEISYRNLS